jgi:predicted helicase
MDTKVETDPVVESTVRQLPQPSGWGDFLSRISSQRASDKGRAFEEIVRAYLKSAPEYASALDEVWALEAVPGAIRDQLNLPRLDEGIDLIARTRSGQFWAIQCKFRTEHEKPLTRRELSTFICPMQPPYTLQEGVPGSGTQRRVREMEAGSPLQKNGN